MPEPLVAVTGASGFIGRHTCAWLSANGFRVRAILRRPGQVPGCEVEVADPLDAERMTAALAGATAVVHLAGRAHVLQERSTDALAEFRRVNVGGSRAVAEAASRSGVTHFVLLSSMAAVAVSAATPLAEDQAPEPGTPYGVSKLEGEQAVLSMASQRMTCTILRPPMVHGPGMQGNPASLLRLLRRGVPLPIGGIGGKRSMIFVENLAAAIGHALASPLGNGTYHLADDQPLTIAEFAEHLGAAMGRPARIVAVPLGALGAAARLGDHLEGFLPMPLTTERLRRVVGPFLVDARRFAATGFRAPVPLDEAMRITAASSAT